ncbi:TetR/AcrR family transcriptional regulator [Ningiella sp. W23]|uniref:TetR/AcrR family transcriptional regulator n=1 Tax=Ningiella sp. W23 TaxID=3023715 RepID=UPI0037573D4A
MRTTDKIDLKPKKPQRKNGRLKYELLTAATEELIKRYGIESLSIQQISKEASVPMASVYHFFPSPVAAIIAVAEKHLSAMTYELEKPIDFNEVDTVLDLMCVFIQRTENYYQKNPIAVDLMLGTGQHGYIRQLDIENNLTMTKIMASQFSLKFHIPLSEELEYAINNCIAICDSIWSLAVAECGRITPKCTKHAIIAVSSYMERITNRL